MASAIVHKLANTSPRSADLGLLVIRLWFGCAMAAAHGYGKVMTLGAFAEKVAERGVPMPWLLGPAAGLSEFLGGLLVAVGLFTRAAATLACSTMVVAAFHIHAADPFQKKELALCYGIAYLAVLIAGPGRFSLDARLFGKN